MKNTMVNTLLSAIFCLSSAATFAADSNSYCGQLHLQITNLTGQACVLVDHNVIHGNLISSPPASIMPNDSKVFDMEQTAYSPNIMLSYRCGDEIISFTSKQNFCAMEAGDIHGEIIDPRPKYITASYMPITGSWLWDKPGSINWQITNQ